MANEEPNGEGQAEAGAPLNDEQQEAAKRAMDDGANQAGAGDDRLLAHEAAHATQQRPSGEE